MSRQVKIDVIVDEHGAVETLQKVAAAEDQVVSGGTKLGTTLDTLSGKQRTTVADTRGMDEAFGRAKVSTVEADNALSAMHVSASKLPSTFSEVRGGLNGLAEGIGITVESLGMFSAAGLVVGTAITAWQVGRAISEFTGLDGAIDTTVSTVRGWVSGSEEAAAKQDTINTALRNGSGVALTYSDAVKFMTEKQREWVEAATEADNAVQRLKAPADSARELRLWGLELDKVRAAGVMPALTADIQSHNFSHAELAQRYRVSTEAIGLLQRQLTDTAKEWKSNDDWIASVVRRLDEQNHKIDESKAKTEEWRLKVREIELGGDHAYSTMHQWLGELARDQKYLNELADQGVQKIIAADAAAKKFLEDELAAAKVQDAIFQAAATRGISTPNDGTQARGPGVNVEGNGSVIRGPAINGGVNSNASVGFKLPSFDVGGPIFRDGPIMAHAGEMVVPKDGMLVKGGGGGATTIINIDIDAKGSNFENDRALDRLTDKIATRLGVRAVERGAVG